VLINKEQIPRSSSQRTESSAPVFRILTAKVITSQYGGLVGPHRFPYAQLFWLAVIFLQVAIGLVGRRLYLQPMGRPRPYLNHYISTHRGLQILQLSFEVCALVIMFMPWVDLKPFVARFRVSVWTHVWVVTILNFLKSLFSNSMTMFPHPPSPVVKNDNSQLMIFPFLSTRYHELTRPQPLQIKKEPANDDASSENHNEVNYYNPPTFNSDHGVHQVKQEVDQQPNDVASALRGKSRCMHWIDELQAVFVNVVDGLGGPWG
ncbi:hypothetical protein HAX54_049356, partial [Datura stramonium]|nr:hypothetical protein [Datura stramonium]